MGSRTAIGAHPGTWTALTDAERLRLIHRLTAPAIEHAIAAFAPAPGSCGLDAGCGAGTQSRLLARAAGLKGRVVGLDLSLPTLAEAPTSPATAAGAVLPVNGSLLCLPFADNSLDWVWCADVLWPEVVSHRPVEAVRELARVVRPGGTVALLFWSSQTLLPGYPELEARLGVAFAEHILPRARVSPLDHHLRALAWLAEAGLTDGRVRTFVAQAQAPLAPALREALTGCFEMLWGEASLHLRKTDRQAVERLCAPDSSACILDQPGYHAFVTYTLFTGTRPLT